MLGYEFDDFDTNEHVVDNPHIRGLTGENIVHILTTRCITSYYPVRTLSYALDYQLWGLNAGGYRVTNGLVHLTNVLLVYWLILRLYRHPQFPRPSAADWRGLLAATASAALFAVHPVVVEPVAWVPGREELLMTLGALGCLHFHMTARRLYGVPRTGGAQVMLHSSAAVCCAAGCLSNAVGVVIPLLATAWDVLLNSGFSARCAYDSSETMSLAGGRKTFAESSDLTRSRGAAEGSLTATDPWTVTRIGQLIREVAWMLAGTAPLWLIGLATLLIKGRDTPAASLASLPAVFSFDWLSLVLAAYWLNIKTLFWPRQLGILYEWILAGGVPPSQLVLGGLSIGLTLLLVWRLRRQRVLAFGLLWFGIALAPTAQVIPHHIARADRFLYLPLVGLSILLAGSLRQLQGTGKPALWRGAVAIVLTSLGLLGALSMRQLPTWRNSFTVWENCLRVSPDNPMAHRCFADLLARRGQFGKAIPHYFMALRVEPDGIETLNNFALRLGAGEDETLRDYPMAIKFAERGCRLTDWKDPKLRHTLALAYTNYAVSFSRRGDFARAIENFQRASEAEPGFDVPIYNLALLLLSCPKEDLRQPQQGAELARQLIAGPKQLEPNRLQTLAEACASAGHWSTAVAIVQKAIEQAEKQRSTARLEDLHARLQAYQNEEPYELPDKTCKELGRRMITTIRVRSPFPISPSPIIILYSLARLFPCPARHRGTY